MVLRLVAGAMQREFATDTIAAIATPRGRGGIGIVRISGPGTQHIANQILGFPLPSPRRACCRDFIGPDGDSIDNGIALYFPAPHSFTGEDVLELHGHGGLVVMDLLLQHTLTLGARVARPGEFSERAFLNEKFDLTQAEAIADLIESHTEQAARCALRSLQGEFSTQVNTLVDTLIDLRSYVEAALDFSEEEIDFLGIDMMSSRLNELQHKINTLLQKAHQGSLLREGMCVVITGRPNAGKSSLLNRLAEQDVAIVSAIPGTTRDVLQREIQLAGMPVRVSDTAGLRQSTEPLEQEGMRRAWQEINGADLIILVVDAQHGYGEQERVVESGLPKKVPLVRVWNKMDLLSKVPEPCVGDVYVSAKTGEGLDELRQRLLAKVDFQGSTEGIFMARRRHLTALRQSSAALEAATRHLHGQCAMELVAEELSNAQRNLGEITGEFTNEDLLGKIFSSFCIGK